PSSGASVEILDATGGSAVENQSTTKVTSTMVIEITAEDGTTKKEYKIELAASSANDIESTSIGTLDEANKKVTGVPVLTKVSELKNAITPSSGASVEILDATGGSAVENQSTTKVTSTMVIEITAEDGTTKKEYKIELAASSANDIESTSVGTLDEANKKVTGVPVLTKVSELKNAITPSSGASVEILDATGGSAVENQSTTKVTSTMVIEITAEDGTTKKEYKIELAASSANDIESTSIGTLDEANKKVTDIPVATKVSELKNAITPSSGASVEILDATGGSAVTNQDDTVSTTMVIEITAEDGTTKQEYNIELQSNPISTSLSSLGRLMSNIINFNR
ncbi:hypothetical protein IC217_08810, partial [Clostridioides sp. ES-W-0017-02]|uniref:hypothetical protein n=1 Tax=Clostridioides sp. ES-W-0017-02 TaxID=2770789 RepID=UPI001D104F28|nr:hypothetical protein [Clostridioides sp. ES-W-0017-02]